MHFHKILIANRGEIACRINRTAQRLGYRTVAVFSKADAGALHVQQADEAVHIGASPAVDSYLNIPALLSAARSSGADAVHPGYGFLSERADFAQACVDAGLLFIGPPAQAIHAMGNKAGAKRRMLAAGVPCVPGYLGEEQSDEHLTVQALALGTPLLVKAVSGGGGRGMRLVHNLAELPAALASARREALSAFGDGTLMLERLIHHGRHIEIQIFADTHGNVVHLGERDCTAQRRRQKVIEEAPSPIVTPALRSAMGAHAVAAAQAVGYVGAGTVEFIVDADLQHYFLEMNTRLQVEHPVTECITGLDLVEWQLRVAAGETLPLRQDQITFSGHAIEARLYAEDPYSGWTPQTGRVQRWRPAGAVGRGNGKSTGIRIEHGLHEGADITPYYDAMVAKFVAHGRDRADAIRRLTRALVDSPLIGLQSNARFLRDLLNHPDFVAAQMTTTRLDEWAAADPPEPLLQRPAVPAEAWLIAAAVRAQTSALRPASVAQFDLRLQCQGQTQTLRAPPTQVVALTHEDGVLRYQIGTVQRQAVCIDDGRTLHLALDGAVFSFTEPSAWAAADTRSDPTRALSPVAGVVAHISVAVGDVVAAGQPLLCVEAMKMEMWLHAAAAGTVRALHTQPKASVAAGALLVEIELHATTEANPP